MSTIELPPETVTTVTPTLETLCATLSPARLLVTDSGQWAKHGAHKPKPISYDSAIGELLTQWGDGETVNSILATYFALFPVSVELATGGDIHDVFENYRPGSCMRYDCCATLREFYAENPDRVGVAYWRKGDHIATVSHGSALLWFGSKAWYLDRVYSEGFSRHVAWKHALRDSIAKLAGELPVKSIHASAFPFVRESAETVTFHSLSCSEGMLPYMDTMRFQWDSEDKTVSVTSGRRDGYCEAHETDGTHVETGGPRFDCECASCGEGLCSDDYDEYTSHNDEIYCNCCFQDRFTRCEISEEYYPSDEGSERTVIDRRGNERTCWIADDTLSNNFHEVVAIPDNPDVTHCHENYCTSCWDENENEVYVFDNAIANSNEDDITDSITHVYSYWSESPIPREIAVWSDEFGTWVYSRAMSDDDFVSDYRRFLKLADSDKRYRVGSLFVSPSLDNAGEWEISHLCHPRLAVCYDLDSALAFFGKLVSGLESYGIAHLLETTTHPQINSGAWSSGDSLALKALLTDIPLADRYFGMVSATFYRQNTKKRYFPSERITVYLNVNGGIRKAWQVFNRDYGSQGKLRHEVTIYAV